MTAEQTWVPADEWDGGELDYDFDAAWATLKPKHVKILGKVYRLPPEMPAKVMILLIRERRARQSGQRSMELLEEILTTMLTPAGYQQVLEDGIGLGTQLASLVDYLVNAYNRPGSTSEGEGDGEGEAPPPQGGTGQTGS